jgi:hypothetical protein
MMIVIRAHEKEKEKKNEERKNARSAVFMIIRTKWLAGRPARRIARRDQQLHLPDARYPAIYIY